MERNQQCNFAVYFDVPNPHVTIHKIGSSSCALEVHGGEHIVEVVSGWRYFVREHEAKSFAEGISKSKNIPEPTYCKKCFRN